MIKGAGERNINSNFNPAQIESKTKINAGDQKINENSKIIFEGLKNIFTGIKKGLSNISAKLFPNLSKNLNALNEISSNIKKINIEIIEIKTKLIETENKLNNTENELEDAIDKADLSKETISKKINDEIEKLRYQVKLNPKTFKEFSENRVNEKNDAYEKINGNLTELKNSKKELLSQKEKSQKKLLKLEKDLKTQTKKLELAVINIKEKTETGNSKNIFLANKIKSIATKLSFKLDLNVSKKTKEIFSEETEQSKLLYTEGTKTAGELRKEISSLHADLLERRKKYSELNFKKKEAVRNDQAKLDGLKEELKKTNINKAKNIIEMF